MKNKLTIFLLIFLTSCGYSAVYKNTKSNSLLINVIGIQGDVEMNNLIRNELELYSNPEAEDIFDINLNTTYEKKIISKDKLLEIGDFYEIEEIKDILETLKPIEFRNRPF